MILYGYYGGEADPLSIAAVVALLAAVHGREWIRDRWGANETERRHDALREAYVSGEIDETEFERRLDVLLDPRNEEIRELVEDVNGVGPITSREIALAFESVGQLRRADQEDLTAVSGVGPERADAILTRVK